MIAYEASLFGAIELSNYADLSAVIDRISIEFSPFYRHWKVYKRKGADSLHFCKESKEDSARWYLIGCA